MKTAILQTRRNIEMFVGGMARKYETLPATVIFFQFFILED